MKKVYFLLPDRVLRPGSLFSAIEVLEQANTYFTSKGRKPYYDIKIIGFNSGQSILNSRFFIKTDNISLKRARPDIIIIPGIHDLNSNSLNKNKNLLSWMIERYKDGCELASLCTGSFMLAATGLLNNEECSTHWAAEKSFMEMFPKVKLCTDKIITDSKGIYTAGGANSSLNLILYLIEKFNGRETAVYCSKILMIDINRSSQAPFVLFEGQKNHVDKDILRVQKFIEANVEEKISVEELAGKFNISRRSFVRRFKKATNNSPLEYMQRIKIEAAKRYLERGRLNINEVMYSLGYSDVKAFRGMFRKITGISPINYRNKYNKEFA